MEKSVSAADANCRFSELLRGVRIGRRYLITSHGLVIAKLIPAEADERYREAARAVLLARLKAQAAVKVATGSTREELYEGR